ncbi:MAG: hypothetical protein QOC71_467 [Thermoplasmata archaeon]|nr:hypothetical protein [Thermoplasmata archaeon]
MQAWTALVIGVLLLGGCLGGDPVETSGPVTADPSPTPPAPVVLACQNGLLFQFVDYAETDPYLPPGFHIRDPQGFLTISPVAFGQAGVLLITLRCEGAAGPYNMAGVDIFVEAPSVPGVDAATFDFYEVERYSSAWDFNDTLAPALWPRIPGHVNFTMLENAEGARAGFANVTDDKGHMASFTGTMDANVGLGPSVVRFWRDGPGGLAYVEYQADLQPLAGPGICSIRPGTTLADLTIPDELHPLLPYTACPPGEPVVATFPHLVVNATARFLPGVRAQ